MSDPIDRSPLKDLDAIGEPSQHYPLRLFQASELLGDQREVGLVHDGALYRLRLTRSGKLILTK
ncbi:hypothetical protein Sa4125_32360 [Aureimonas sp. SA4125]|uniref:hemin uptake protein HemP n=1 Tax=Aureimonas sp. SA4125 TaxID=2826993 RepID=UPI001CC76084|nr:hemin uptake protein HemP [Aureimonas sp. SA4125]BDA85694.1 hypothetical protein Sa4125_32360 [Aureimonas sp. SA4125]